MQQRLIGTSFLFPSAVILLHATIATATVQVVPLQLSDLIGGVSFSLTEDLKGPPGPVLDLIGTDEGWQPSSIGDLLLIDLNRSISDIVRSISLGGQANLFSASAVFDPGDLRPFSGRHFANLLDEGAGDLAANLVGGGGVTNAQIFSDAENGGRVERFDHIAAGRFTGASPGRDASDRPFDGRHWALKTASGACLE